MTDNLRPTLLRGKAWERLSGKWGKSAVTYLIVLLLSGASGSLNFLIPGAPVLAVIFFTNLITIGTLFLFWDVADGKDVEIATIFSTFNDYVRYMIGGLLVFIYTFLWSLLLVVPGIIKAISYSQTYFLMRDNPTLSGEQAIQCSMAMMHGHKMEYFLFCLSFIGWILLSVITLGIGMLWIGPYITTARAEFYKALKLEQDIIAA